LLVLRAFEPVFPNALFFTFNYDHSFQSQKEIKYTRNLLIVAAHDPDPNSVADTEITKIADPKKDSQTNGYFLSKFRNDFQSTIFVTITKIIKKDDKSNPAAKIFEVSRTGNLINLNQIEKSDNNLIGNNTLFFLSALLGTLSISTFFYRFCLGGVAAKPTLFIFLASSVTLVILWFFNKNPLLQPTNIIEPEPFFLFEGVSVWPVIIIKFLFLLFFGGWIFWFKISFGNNLGVLKKEMLMNDNDGASQKPSLLEIFLEIFKFHFLDIFGVFLPKTPCFVAFENSAEYKEYYSAEVGFKKYISYARTRFTRALFITLASLALIYLTYYENMIIPSPPMRYATNWHIPYIYYLFTLLEYGALIFVTYVVVDATLYCLIFVNDLELPNTRWLKKSKPDGIFTIKRKCIRNILKKTQSDVFDLHFIQNHTKFLLSLIYSPLFFLALSIFATSKLFSNYPQTSFVYFIFEVASILLLLSCGIALEIDSHKFKTKVKKDLETDIDKLEKYESKLNIKQNNLRLRQGARDFELALHKLRNYSTQVDKYTEGAFAPLWRQPALVGLALPVAGYAGNYIFDKGWFLQFMQ